MNKNKPTIIDKYGTKYWKNDNGQFHRLDGPAIEYSDGTKYWWAHGKRHRADGPAIEGVDGSKFWYIEGVNYSEEDFNLKVFEMNNDKPTVVDRSGNKFWRNDKGQLHRINGPAIEYPDGSKSWWFNGQLHREDGPAFEYVDGYKEWWVYGERHRLDGPAIEYSNGTKSWYIEGIEYSEEDFKLKVSEMNKDKPTIIDEYGNKLWVNDNGQLHREDGPAMEMSSGYKKWYFDDKLHREDGPAVEYCNGYKEWWIHGKLHRLDGPAIEWANGNKEWYIEGIKYSEEEFKTKVSKMNKDKPTKIDSDGNKYWRNDKGLLHREDGPAIEDADGTKKWYVNGELHRIDGPAIEYADGDKHWYLNDELHREDGPALERSNGDKEWYVSGELHRIDGPAIEWANENKLWYLDGEEYTEEEFNNMINNSKVGGVMGIIDRISENETIGIVKDSATTAVKLTLARQTSKFLADITRKILATGMEKAGYGDKTGILYTPLGDFIVELTIPIVIHSIATNEKLPKYNSEIETISEWAIRANLSLYTMRFADQGADLLKASLSDKHIQEKVKQLLGLGAAIKKAESGDNKDLKNITTPNVDIGLNLEEEDEENLGLHEVPGIALD